MYANVLPKGLFDEQNIHETNKHNKFLMKLRREFETIKSNLISKESVQLLDSFVGELLKEEQRLNIQVVLE